MRFRLAARHTRGTNRKPTLADAVLWASAILASGIVHAPPVLPCVLLPVLCARSLIVTGTGACRRSADVS